LAGTNFGSGSIADPTVVPERVWTNSSPLALSARSISAGSGSRGAGETAAATGAGGMGLNSG
jgi:hypothetical protein